MIKVHHLNCGTMRPLLGKLTGGASWWSRGHMVCHCWLIETPGDGLILVDTGLGRFVLERPDREFQLVSGMETSLAETAHAQVQALGFAPTDVRHVVVTHLDLDHAGGLVDFPWATVHVHAAELAAANQREGLFAKRRYRPDRWAHDVRWATYQHFGDVWMGLPATQALRGVKADIALVPLIGHTRGHSAVAVRGATQWMMHAGDALYHRDELTGNAPWGIRALATAFETDHAQRVASLAELQRLATQGVAIMSAHDPHQLPPLL